MPQPNNPVARPPKAPGKSAQLNEWLSYLEAIHPTEIELGLDRVLIVFRRLFRRNPASRIITVGGTNGKGSAVAAIDKILRDAGRRTGTYTSPHLEKYNERVKIRGVEASDAQLVKAFEAVEAARGDTSLTYFEFGTLAAFLVLEAAQLDDWILEVGLGGRLDAVNVLDADFAIITSVDIDHVAFLGNDRETIGFEKAGILRPGMTAVFGDTSPPASVLQQASAQKVKLLRPGHGYALEHSGPGSDQCWLSIEGQVETIELPLNGLPVNSLAAAAVAVRHLEPDVSSTAIAQSLKRLTLSGRFEQLRTAPSVVVDVGHNPHAAHWLAERLGSIRSPQAKVIAVYAALGDKDIDGVLAQMASVVDQWYLAGLDVPRGLSTEALEGRAAAQLERDRVLSFESVTSAVETALNDAAEDDTIIVFGSFFTVAEARRLLVAPPADGS